MLERCWTHTCPGVEPLLLSIGLETVCPWLLVPHWSSVLLLRIRVLVLVLLH